MVQLLSDHLIIEGRRIAVGVHGPVSGSPVVLVHGTPSHSFIWRAVVPRLTERGYLVHLFDLLGYGASERPLEADTSIAGQEAILLGLLDAWGLDRPHLVAHDIGGGLGLRLAVRSPGRLGSLTLVDCVSYDSWPSETWRRIIDRHFDRFRSMPPEDCEAMMTRQLMMTVHVPDRMSGEVLEAYLAPLRGELGQASYFRHQMAHYDGRYTDELTPRLGEIDLPVRLVWGAEDRWQPLSWARRLAADIPGATLSVIPKAGHFVMEDAPEAVADAVLDFLDRNRRAER